MQDHPEWKRFPARCLQTGAGRAGHIVVKMLKISCLSFLPDPGDDETALL